MGELKTQAAAGEHLNDEDVALFVDALRLNTVEQLPAPMRDHVAECHSCKKEITGLFALLGEDRNRTVDVHPYFVLPPRTKKVRGFPLLRTAAALAAVAALSALAYYLIVTQSARGPVRLSEERAGGSVDSVRREGGDSTTGMHDGRNSDLAAAMTVNPDLEDLVNSRSRSEEFEAFSPVNGTVITSRPVFRWKGTEPGSLTLTLIDNKGKAVFSARVHGTTYSLTQRLVPGLYYWKVQSESELLFVGKFFVMITRPSRHSPPT